MSSPVSHNLFEQKNLTFGNKTSNNRSQWQEHYLYLNKETSKVDFPESLGGAAVWRLPLPQGAILETRDRIPYQAPGAWSLLLPPPVSLPLSLCDYHK